MNKFSISADLLACYYGRRSEMSRPGEHTGMVFCPMKLAGIAVERCGQYQQSLGCGAACPAKAGRKEISASKAARRNEDLRKFCNFYRKNGSGRRPGRIPKNEDPFLTLRED